MEAKPTVQDSRRSLKYTPEVFEKHAEAQQALWFLYSNLYTVSQKNETSPNRDGFGSLIDARLIAVREVYAWILEGNLVRTHLHTNSGPDFFATSNASVV